jgi:hypothetical protein
MRQTGLLLLAFVTLAQAPRAQAPQTPGAPASDAQPAAAAPAARPAPVGTMSELMLKVIYPYSDAMFYIQRSPPKNEIEWNELQGKALALAEFGNVMMMQGRARDQDQWLRDAKLLAEAGAAAFRLAKAKDVEGIVGLNEQLVMSCTSCHMHYRPNYGRRRPPAQGSPAQGSPAQSPPAQSPPSALPQ